MEGDAELIREQQIQIERSGKSMKELFLPLKTSDVLVIEYRKWLDKYGTDLPFYQGYETSNLHDIRPPVEIGDRFTRHTQICNSCNGVHQISSQVKQSSIIVAIILAAIAMITENYQARIFLVTLFILALSMAFAAQRLKMLLERTYVRQYMTTEKTSSIESFKKSIFKQK